MIWSKTDEGRAEMQTRALVKERSQRNLLLLIDGVKTEEMLLANVVGVKPEDFKLLESLNLITPVAGSLSRTGAEKAPVFAETENPFPWMSEAMDLKKEKNFFETRVIEYQNGGALAWD